MAQPMQSNRNVTVADGWCVRTVASPVNSAAWYHGCAVAVCDPRAPSTMIMVLLASTAVNGWVFPMMSMKMTPFWDFECLRLTICAFFVTVAVHSAVSVISFFCF
jgi:hypothetical protein